jgi:hypothetical protein
VAPIKDIGQQQEGVKGDYLFLPISRKQQELDSAARRVLLDKKKNQERVDQEEQTKVDAADSLIKVPDASSGRGPRNLRVSSLNDLPPSFVESKSVMDMHCCVTHLDSFRNLVKDHHLSKFIVFWAR